MKKHLVAFVATIIMMVSGAYLGYAAFPVSTPASSAAPSRTAPTVTQIQEDNSAPTNQNSHGADKPASSGKSQIVAAILCFFIGSLGIHRFYLGYTWQGVVQILTLGGCGIWTLIDFIRILTGDLGPKDGKYAKTF